MNTIRKMNKGNGKIFAPMLC